jgi:pimeloyl-ACP methyl ester carboxylesterase
MATDGFSLATLEFDDHGEPWGRDSLDQLMYTLDAVSGGFDEPLQPQGAVVVVFVHGWKHNAHANDGNLISFRKLLTRLVQDERLREQPRNVLGIYVGWRGDSLALPEPLKSLSFFDRYDAAARVSGPAMTQTLFAIMKVVRRNPNSRCILVGHSMGGFILQKAVVQAFVGLIAERATDVVAYRSELRRRNSGAADARAPSETYGYRPPADLVVFVNSAAPAIESKQFIEIIDQLAFEYYFTTLDARRRAEQKLSAFVATPDIAAWRPFVLSITSEGDWATGKIFPFALGIDSIGKRFRKYDGEDDWDGDRPTQRYLYRRAAAFVPDLTSHVVTVEQAKTDKARAFVPCDDLHTTVSATPDRLCFESHGRRFTVARKAEVPLAGLSLGVPTFNRTPYWVMKVPRGIIKDHNDIFNEALVDLLKGIIVVAAELHEMEVGPQWEPLDEAPFEFKQ